MAGTPVDGHHGQMRLPWHLGPHDEDAPIIGFDVATVTPDGRIDQVLEFLDRVPA